MSNLPSGWSNRKNQMSEHDMKLGGVAQTKFGGTAKNAYEADVGGDGGYKNDDQVRDFYLRKIQLVDRDNNKSSSSSSNKNGNLGVSGEGMGGGAAKYNNVPDLWEERQKERESQGKQMGVFSKNQPPKDNNPNNNKNGNTNNSPPSSSAELALVQIATHTLDTMAKSLNLNSNNTNDNGKEEGVKIPMAERMAFAKAVKDAMDALAKQAN
eukprot:CAMPEP_0201661454 /NCGR_PEP_ID=MMETSP0494-20130426/3821_1 /ASSEMBLY_ACC=CAM_ASM_000839 /TAXON_ID=420259 /ORGANISM="Thalassiosira gravida, Strain GMp14c1" /LENGTH=210 /DNA_ID=CAMNT_0048139569 /DNA_START=162 /DNA_END=792 /DNA_ORIENTATION=+